jgi:hypothetical protein
MYIITFSHYFVENAEFLSRQSGMPIVYQLEPGHTYHIFSAHDAAKHYIKLLKDNTVYQYSPMIAKFCLSKHKIECASYFAFDYPQLDSKMERDVNVLWFGTMTKKRYDILSAIQQKFNVTLVTSCFGQELEDTLLRTKYVLNVSAYGDNALETHRINKALACGCKVISNPSCDKEMDRKYKDIVIFTKGRSVYDYMKELSKLQLDGFNV